MSEESEEGPKKLYFDPHFFGPEPPRGWSYRPRRFFSLGFSNMYLRSEHNLHAIGGDLRKCFYAGFRPPRYPHIVSLHEKELHLLVAKVGALSGDLNDQSGEMVRPTWGFVNLAETEAVPVSTDNRVIWPSHGHIRDLSKMPYNVPLLPEGLLERVLRYRPDSIGLILGKR